MSAGPGYGDDVKPRTRTLTFKPGEKTWEEAVPPVAGTPEGDLYLIRRLIVGREYRKALRALKAFEKDYGEEGPRKPEVMLARAESYLGLKKYDKAHDILTAFLAEFGGMSFTPEALRMEFLVAEAYLSGVKRKFWGMKMLDGVPTAYRILDDISIDYSEDPLAEAAIKTKGDYMYRKGDYALAELEYERLLKEHPMSRYHQYALSRSAEAALSSHAGVEYDEAALIEAEERYREFGRQYPGAASRDGVPLILNGIREQRAEKEFITAQYYERTEHFRTAVFYYESVVQNWPDTLAASKAANRLALMGPVE
ncbi:MAG: outer membrane protein assembly factor BamD [Planctomycetota bacterium]